MLYYKEGDIYNIDYNNWATAYAIPNITLLTFGSDFLQIDAIVILDKVSKQFRSGRKLFLIIVYLGFAYNSILCYLGVQREGAKIVCFLHDFLLCASCVA